MRRQEKIRAEEAEREAGAEGPEKGLGRGWRVRMEDKDERAKLTRPTLGAEPGDDWLERREQICKSGLSMSGVGSRAGRRLARASGGEGEKCACHVS